MKTGFTNKISTPVFALLALILFGATNITAAPGDLDPTFGSGGKVIIRDGDGFDLQDANGTAIQADGKIVVVGRGGYPGTAGFAVVRFNTDGSLDTSFGGTGIVSTPVGGGFSNEAFSVAIQADGKIVVAGSGYGGFGVVRYNPNGSLDTTFNGTGKVITPVNTGGVAWAVTIQADGKIVVAGQGSLGQGSDFALVRYNTDGSLDTSFGGTGIVITPIGNSSYASSVAIQADGKIVAAGASYSDAIRYGFAVVRYNPNGSLDTTFNGTGKVITPGGGANSVTIQTDGKIIAAGERKLVRYNANGTPDTSFNGTGIVSIPIYVRSAAIQADGKIVAAGASMSFIPDFAAARLNPNGSLDTTFNFDGVVITPIYVGNQYGNWDYANAAAIQSDGKIVVAGQTEEWLYDFFDFAVVRYQGGSNANIRTRFDFDGDARADISVFRPSDRVWYLNRSTAGFSATQFGLSTDKITPADFDGDGRTDISVYRDGTWYWLNSSNGNFNAVQFGLPGDFPVPADYTGDGQADLAIYRSGAWWIQDLTNNQTQVVNFGLSTDKPVAADYDGDGRSDQAVYRGGEWHLNRSTEGYSVVNFGLSTDQPVIGDYDGDGKTDLAVYRNGTWYLLQSAQGFAAFQWGISTDIPVPADFDGDGRTDGAVFRDGIWYLLQSTNGISVQQFGLANDNPIPAAFRP